MTFQLEMKGLCSNVSTLYMSQLCLEVKKNDEKGRSTVVAAQIDHLIIFCSLLDIGNLCSNNLLGPSHNRW